MPLVLPPAQPRPSFKSSLGANLGTGISQGIQGSLDFARKMKLQEQKNESKNSFLSKLFAGSNVSGMDAPDMSKKEHFSLSPEQETALALSDPSAFGAYKHLKESRVKEQEEFKQKENLKMTLDEMTDTLLKGKLGYTTDRFLTKEGRRDAQYFDSLGLQLESLGKEMVSKGVLSAPRFAYLISNLPSSKNDDATNAGSLEAWSKELGMPISEDIKKLYKSRKKGEKTGKIKFDINNPEHKAKRNQLLEKFSGDRKKVMEALSREFEE